MFLALGVGGADKLGGFVDRKFGYGCDGCVVSLVGEEGGGSAVYDRERCTVLRRRGGCCSGKWRRDIAEDHRPLSHGDLRVVTPTRVQRALPKKRRKSMKLMDVNQGEPFGSRHVWL